MAPPARASIREPAGNLPVDVTSFVGRRREITLIKRLLAESRVVTLTGPGGVGKTRLAMRVATNLRRNFRDKAWCVELEELRDPGLLPEAVSEQLGLPVNGRVTVDSVIEQFRNREMLLVLDNCEHLVDDVALFADTVIRRCPGVRILATSRQSLGVAGESTMVVPPLQVPDLEHLPPPDSYEQFASVRLFLDRARAVLPELTIDASNGPALMRLCHHLDGNPLAIELAAVRLRLLSLDQLEERLSERYDLLTEGRRGAPARQQTLRALIDWSYELLTEGERTTWARISVFSGSFELEAAERVASNGLSHVAVLGAMHSLVDKSILVREEESGEVRYRMQQILREYGQDRLRESGDIHEVRRSHWEWYADVVGRFAAGWFGGEQIAWVEELRKEQGNIRTALHAAVQSPEGVDAAVRIVARLGEYWSVRGQNTEARFWLEKVLAVATERTSHLATALRSNAWFALMQGEASTAEANLNQAAALAEELGDKRAQANVTEIRGMAALFSGDRESAAALLENSLERLRGHHAPQSEAFALFGLGLTEGLSGRYERGLQLLGECVDRMTELDELFWRSYALWATAYIEIFRGNIDAADDAAKRALDLKRRLDNRLAIAFSLDTLAWIAQLQGRDERAAQLFGAAHALWEVISTAPAFYARFKIEHAKYQDRATEALGAEAFQEAFDRGYQMSSAAALDFALEIKRNTRSGSRSRSAQTTPLTRREREIAALVAQGRTNKEIAETLVIAQRTVEGHVQHILSKLDFNSRAQIAGWIAGQHIGGPAEPTP